MNAIVVVFHNADDGQVSGNMIENCLRDRGQERDVDGVCFIEYNNGCLLICPDASVLTAVEHKIAEVVRRLEPPRARKALVVHQNTGARGEHKTLRREDGPLPFATTHDYSHLEWDPVYQGVVRLLQPDNNELLGNLKELGGEQILSVRLFSIRVRIGTILEKLNLCLRWLEDANFDEASRRCHGKIIQGNFQRSLVEVSELLHGDDSVKFVAEEFQAAGHVLKIDKLYNFFPDSGNAETSISMYTNRLDGDISRINSATYQKAGIVESIQKYSIWCSEMIDTLNDLVRAAEKLEKQDVAL